MGHLNGILAQVGGNLNSNFQKSQMPGGLPGGGMLKLRFDRYIRQLKIYSSDLAIKHFKITAPENSSLWIKLPASLGANGIVPSITGTSS